MLAALSPAQLISRCAAGEAFQPPSCALVVAGPGAGHDLPVRLAKQAATVHVRPNVCNALQGSLQSGTGQRADSPAKPW